MSGVLCGWRGWRHAPSRSGPARGDGPGPSVSFELLVGGGEGHTLLAVVQPGSCEGGHARVGPTIALSGAFGGGVLGRGHSRFLPGPPGACFWGGVCEGWAQEPLSGARVVGDVGARPLAHAGWCSSGPVWGGGGATEDVVPGHAGVATLVRAYHRRQDHPAPARHRRPAHRRPPQSSHPSPPATVVPPSCPLWPPPDTRLCPPRPCRPR